MLGTYNDWMLSLPAILQVLVALATLTVIGLTPLLLWLGFAVISTRDASRGSQDPREAVGPSGAEPGLSAPSTRSACSP